MPQQTAVANRCGVCRRPLRNSFSMMVGVGPTCAKKVRREIARQIAEARENNNGEQVQQLTAIMHDFRFATPDELRSALLHDVANASRSARRHPRPSASPVTVTCESRSRGVRNENIRVEWIDANTCITHSTNGHQYQTTAHACSCADYLQRRGSYNEQGEYVGRGTGFCRHMVAVQMAQREISERRRANYRNRHLQIENTEELPIHSDVSLTSQQPVRGRFGGRNNVANLEVQAHEENREVMLGHDYNEHIRNSEGHLPLEYVDYVRNDQAWNDIKREALEEEHSLNLEENLFHTSQTWGVEIETHFPNQAKQEACLQELYQKGFIHAPRVMGYHSSAPSGYFKAERDGSITTAGYPSFEFVTPKMTDTKEDKERFLEATKILEKYGAFQTKVCGTHVTLDQTGLSHDGWAMQRFARTLVQNEHLIAQVASGDPVKYKAFGVPRNDQERQRLEEVRQLDRQNGTLRDDTERMAEIRGRSIREAQGSFRHGSYTTPFKSNLSFGGNLSIPSMRSEISPSRYTMVSFRDSERVEFRVNQGVNGEELLRKARFYDALKTIGRDIRNENEGAEYSARFSERNKQLRINGDQSQYETRLRELCSLVRDKNVVKDIIRFTRMGRV